MLLFSRRKVAPSGRTGGGANGLNVGKGSGIIRAKSAILCRDLSENLRFCNGSGIARPVATALRPDRQKSINEPKRLCW